MSQPSLTTHGLKAGAFSAQLRGTPMPTPASHDPALTVDRVAISPGDGVGTRPLTMPAHFNETLRIYVELDEVPNAQFLEYVDIVDQAAKGYTVSYSPLGETTYTSSGWTLVSTTAGWVETRYGVWSGAIELVKKGGSL